VLRIPRGDEALVEEGQEVVVRKDHGSGGVGVLCRGIPFFRGTAVSLGGASQAANDPLGA
jgi:hypothetical protein